MLPPFARAPIEPLLDSVYHGAPRVAARRDGLARARGAALPGHAFPAARDTAPRRWQKHVYHLRNTHFNRRGNEVVGKALAEFLGARLAQTHGAGLNPATVFRDFADLPAAITIGHPAFPSSCNCAASSATVKCAHWSRRNPVSRIGREIRPW